MPTMMYWNEYRTDAESVSCRWRTDSVCSAVGLARRRGCEFRADLGSEEELAEQILQCVAAGVAGARLVGATDSQQQLACLARNDAL